MTSKDNRGWGSLHRGIRVLIKRLRLAETGLSGRDVDNGVEAGSQRLACQSNRDLCGCGQDISTFWNDEGEDM